MMRHLKRLSNRFTIPIPSDEEGYLGRECPQSECQGYFKIKLGTGIQEVIPCYCPYCGYTSDQSQFWTQDQIKYAKSVMINQLNQALKKDFKEMDRKLRYQSRNSFLKLSMEFKVRRHPIRHYREKQLETEIVCDHCNLQYTIYGVFSYCPDCGTHNSLQILKKNFELAQKEIALAETVEDADLAEVLMADALENVVSAFDGFGRKACQIYKDISSEPEKAENLSFQGLFKTRRQIQDLFDFDLAQGLNPNEWDFVCQCFQKRHLLAHRMGIVDEAYLKFTKDQQAIIGRKVTIEPNEITTFVEKLERLGTYFIAQLSTRTTSNLDSEQKVV